MGGPSSPGGAGALALLALAGAGCMAVYRPDQDLIAASGEVEARVLEIRAEPFLRTSLAVLAPEGTQLRAVTLSSEQGRCQGPTAVLQTVDGVDVALPSVIAGPLRLEVYFPDPRVLAGSATWLGLTYQVPRPPAGNLTDGCLTLPLVAPSIRWQRDRAWGAGGFVRGQSLGGSPAGSGPLLSLGGWWRRSGRGHFGMSAELGLAVGWCGDFDICGEYRFYGLTGSLAGQAYLLRTRRLLIEGELALEMSTIGRESSNALWLMATPRATLRAWRSGPRLLGFSPDLRIGALGVEFSYGARFARAGDKAGSAPVYSVGLVVQPAL